MQEVNFHENDLSDLVKSFSRVCIDPSLNHQKMSGCTKNLFHKLGRQKRSNEKYKNSQKCTD